MAVSICYSIVYGVLQELLFNSQQVVSYGVIRI